MLEVCGERVWTCLELLGPFLRTPGPPGPESAQMQSWCIAPWAQSIARDGLAATRVAAAICFEFRPATCNQNRVSLKPAGSGCVKHGGHGHIVAPKGPGHGLGRASVHLREASRGGFQTRYMAMKRAPKAPLGVLTPELAIFLRGNFISGHSGARGGPKQSKYARKMSQKHA